MIYLMLDADNPQDFLKQVARKMKTFGFTLEDMATGFGESMDDATKAADAFKGNVPPAPSTAAAAPLPTAHEDAQASSAPPPPATSAPAATTAVGNGAQTVIPLAPAGNVEVDSTGLPWDERIHSGGRKKTQKGEWTKRRGVQELTVNKVEAELRERLAASPTPGTLPAVASQAPEPPAPGVAPKPPAPPIPQGEGLTFAQVIDRVTSAITNGKWTHTTLNVKLLEIGANKLEDLSVRPDLLAKFAKELPALS